MEATIQRARRCRRNVTPLLSFGVELPGIVKAAFKGKPVGNHKLAVRGDTQRQVRIWEMVRLLTRRVAVSRVQRRNQIATCR